MIRCALLLLLLWISPFGEANVGTDLKVLSTNYEPYNYQNIHREPDGYATRIVQALLLELTAASPVKVTQIEFLPWARSYHIAETTPDSLIFSIARTPDREDKFTWIGKLLPMPVYLYKHAQRKDVIADVQTANRVWSVAGVNNGAPTNCVEGLGYKVVHKSANYDIQFKMLLKGRVDLMVFDSISFAQEVQQNGYTNKQFEPFLYLPECSYDLYLALNKHSSAHIVKAVQSAWQSITAQGTVAQFQQAFEDTYQPFH